MKIKAAVNGISQSLRSGKKFFVNARTLNIVRCDRHGLPGELDRETLVICFDIQIAESIPQRAPGSNLVYLYI